MNTQINGIKKPKCPNKETDKWMNKWKEQINKLPSYQTKNQCFRSKTEVRSKPKQCTDLTSWIQRPKYEMLKQRNRQIKWTNEKEQTNKQTNKVPNKETMFQIRNGSKPKQCNKTWWNLNLSISQIQRPKYE